MPVVAAIDIGTNSVKTTIAEALADGGIQIVDQLSSITLLGRGVDATGVLASESMEATLAALVTYVQRASEWHAVRIAAVGTSALRDAKNGPEFVASVKKVTGLDVEIISGEREAKLSYFAALSDQDIELDRTKPIAVCDIGGGSTEVVIGCGSTLQFHKSFNIGAVRLTEMYAHHDPLLETELASMNEFAMKVLSEVPSNSVAQAVGVGGTLTNVLGLWLGRYDKPVGMSLSLDDVESVLAKCVSVKLEARKQYPGLDPARADVINAGATILLCVMRSLGVERVGVTQKGIRYGLLKELANLVTG